ncbi:MAG: hypothetical protein B6U68_03010 [Candidatus Aenigmarchaeota archaeon ex4484_14]|nr:MAG: hypothetical protein B6U68_03010 [Candidatus Aenigmarchaeota archaeon ex4484_14]
MEKEVIYGIFVGAGVLFLLMPIFLSFGMTKHTSILLYYSVPVTGALTGYVLSKIRNSPDLTTSKKINETGSILGKDVKITTNNGALSGNVKADGSKVIILTENDGAEHLVEKNKIISLELLDAV